MESKKLSMFGPLPIRILAGITFIAHGIAKFENVAGTQGFFGSIGLPPELALPIGLLEVMGGIFLLCYFYKLLHIVMLFIIKRRLGFPFYVKRLHTYLVILW